MITWQGAGEESLVLAFDFQVWAQVEEPGLEERMVMENRGLPAYWERFPGLGGGVRGEEKPGCQQVPEKGPCILHSVGLKLVSDILAVMITSLGGSGVIRDV